MSRGILTITLGVALAGLAPAAGIATDGNLPPQLREAKIEQRIGEKIPLDLTFLDASGEPFRLEQAFTDRPVVLVPVYFNCPMLCDLVLHGLTRSLNEIAFDAGDAFAVIVFSFDPAEGPELARREREAALARYDRPGTEAGWHFLTGDERSIRRLTEALGFGAKFVPETGEWAHSSALILATPDGQIARYFYGVEFPTRDVRLGLVETAENRLGSVVDQVLLFCFTYDPQSGTYSAMVLDLVRAAGIATILGLGLFFFVMWRRSPDQTPERETD